MAKPVEKPVANETAVAHANGASAVVGGGAVATIPLTLTIPDDAAQAVIDAFCEAYGYDATMGLTQRQFIKSCVGEHIKLPYAKKIRAAKIRQAQLDADAAVAAISVS